MFNIGDSVNPKYKMHADVYGKIGTIITINPNGPYQPSYRILFSSGMEETFSHGNLVLFAKAKPKIKSRPWK